MFDEPNLLEISAQRVIDRGLSMGLTQVAAWADLSSARPATASTGLPIPQLFQFTEVAQNYWQQSDLALKTAVITLIRNLSEPFWYSDGDTGGWRPLQIDPRLTKRMKETNYSVRRAIIAPVRLAHSVLGAVVWASDRADIDAPRLFEAHSDALYAEATRFITACDEVAHGRTQVEPLNLTRREIQCLKLVAAGKSDGDIAQILGLTAPTIRFHLRNAGNKLGRNGRLRIAQRAASLGFVSIR